MTKTSQSVRNEGKGISKKGEGRIIYEIFYIFPELNISDLKDGVKNIGERGIFLLLFFVGG